MSTRPDTEVAASRLRRLVFRLETRGLVLVSSVVDSGPDLLRFGAGRSLRNRIWARPLAALPELLPERTSPSVPPAPASTEQQCLVVLVTRTLGTGGVEAVVATLARELPHDGVRTVVICHRGGATADRLRSAGVEVVEAEDLDTAVDFLHTLPDHAVAQLHNAPEHLIEACARRGFPTVRVIHTTDINLGPDGWDREAASAAVTAATVAVSDKVRDYQARNLPRSVGSPIYVIPNGVELGGVDPDAISSARAGLGNVLGIDLREAVVVCCLARYDLQKNIPGMVAAFLQAAQARPDLHLVVAGPIEDWLEHALANAVRRSHPAGDRVHLMASGSTRTLLAASDAFILDSFFEGWPIAATEAARSGLPLILSDVGGAAELVGPASERGRVFANPAGHADTISLARIRRARRRIIDQTNSSELQRAVLEVCREIDDWRARRSSLSDAASSWLSSKAMVEAHAMLLRRVANAEAVTR